MTPAELAAQYRDLAANCVLLAQSQQRDTEKLALIDMANAWVALAEHAERNGSVFAAYETPTLKPTEDE
jgi:hypothetical protein